MANGRGWGVAPAFVRKGSTSAGQAGRRRGWDCWISGLVDSWRGSKWANGKWQRVGRRPRLRAEGFHFGGASGAEAGAGLLDFWISGFVARVKMGEWQMAEAGASDGSDESDGSEAGDGRDGRRRTR